MCEWILEAINAGNNDAVGRLIQRYKRSDIFSEIPASYVRIRIEFKKILTEIAMRIQSVDPQQLWIGRFIFPGWQLSV